MRIKVQILIQELFYVLSAGAVVLFLSEIVWPGVVMSHFNLNWLLILWLFGGILFLRINNEKI